MGVFKKQNIFGIYFYVNSYPKRERFGTDKRLGNTVLCKRRVAMIIVDSDKRR